MSWWLVTLITVGLIIVSAFFVIVEFALLAARRHRLEAEAPHSMSARAALRGMNELTIMLAAAQLGITVATFLLGAITKKQLDYAVGPILQSWGLPEALAGVIAFVFALLAVTFLHLVIGEMAPKSWAIAHPEVAAKVIGVPSRAFAFVFRPLLAWINNIANRLVARSGVEPVDKAAAGGQDVDTIRELVAHSRAAGVLEPQFSAPIVHAIELGSLTVGDIVKRGTPTSVPVSATAADVQAAAAESGHLRILVGAGADCQIAHVRDTLMVDPATPASTIARQAYVISPTAAAYDVLAQLRRRHEQLGVVVENGRLIGVVSLNDLLREVLPGSAEASVDATAEPVASR